MEETLILSALEARKNAYAPYSNYFVGVAVLAQDNKIYLGCNIENASYSATVCAERTAIFKAISQGNRKIKAIAIAGGNKEESKLLSYAYPCGICRQVISEFSDSQTVIIVAKSEKEYKCYKISELIPFAFGMDNL